MNPLTLYRKFGRRFLAGTVLFREGDPGADMYIIQSGRVQITRRVGAQEAVLAVLPAGEFFGEMSIVNNRPRSATATVVDDATLLVIDAKTFEAMIRGSAEIAVRMIKKLTDRLDQADRQIEMLLYREPNHRVVHYLRGEAEARGRPHAGGTAVQVSESLLAERVGLPSEDVRQVVDRLVRARLIARTEDGASLVIFDVGKLQEFIDFLDVKEKLGV
jgi:CRP/FNR family transcriptional regulator, cyclic AMP receptor protein